ncbi:MAG: nuclear transport factor 2 family protein [Hyphomicrobiales bacterium]|nr:nuclear transport factor 2 family protein [Hyphomicrobiales bacterium]
MTAEKIVDRYLAIWNERDADKRRALIAQAWTEDAVYVDPVMRGAGHDGIDAMIAGAQARFPGFRFSTLGAPDAHNDRLRFRWTAGPEDGPTVIDGADYATLAADGRLASVCGFLDRVPAQ